MPLQEFKKGIRGDPVTRAAWVVAILLMILVGVGLGLGLYSLITGLTWE